jgi:hypothetical protein
MSSNDACNRPEFTLEDALNEARLGCLDLFLNCIRHRHKGNRYRATVEWELAKCRFYGTGPYAEGGLYDKILPGWRDSEVDHRQVAWRRATMPRNAAVITVQIAPITDAVTDP